jgi:hypothetical protein
MIVMNGRRSLVRAVLAERLPSATALSMRLSCVLLAAGLLSCSAAISGCDTAQRSDPVAADALVADAHPSQPDSAADARLADSGAVVGDARQGEDAAPSQPSRFVACPDDTARSADCDAVGGDALQQLADRSAGYSAKEPLVIALKPGRYTRQNYSSYQVTRTDGSLLQRKAFLVLKGLHVRLAGAAGVVFDGLSSAPMAGLVIEDGSLELDQVALIGFRSDANSCLASSAAPSSDAPPVCSAGHALVARGSAKATVSRAMIEQCTTTAVVVQDRAELSIIASRLTDNAKEAIFAQNRAVLSAQNCLIANNGDDGIILLHDAFARVTNATIVGNASFGIAVYSCNNHAPQLIAANNILANTRPDGNGAFGYGIGGSCLHKEQKSGNISAVHNLFWNNAGQSAGCNDDEICRSYQASFEDPKFVDAQRRDYHLQSDSPARHTGHPNSQNPDGSTADRGAYGGKAACLLDPALPVCEKL